MKQDLNINSIGSGSTTIQISQFLDEGPLLRKKFISPKLNILRELTVGNNFNINIGGGTLNAVLCDMSVGTNFNVTCAAGAATINVSNSTVGQNANITTGVGADNVTLSGFTAKTLNVSLGSNSDSLFLTSTVTTVGTNLYGDAGFDSLSYMAGGNSLAKLKFFGFELVA